MQGKLSNVLNSIARECAYYIGCIMMGQHCNQQVISKPT